MFGGYAIPEPPVMLGEPAVDEAAGIVADLL